jgi:poly [ADP-ribose] polymerase
LSQIQIYSELMK